MQHTIKKGEGRNRIELIAIDTGDGIVVCLTGGEAAHVGGAVLAAPRKSLTGTGIGCDLWIVTAPGHKDTFLAQKVAQSLCVALGVNISVTAGIHIDSAAAEELKLIEKNSMEAVNEYLRILRVEEEG